MYFLDLEQYEDWDAHVTVLKSNIGELSPRITRALEIVKKYHDQPKFTTEGNYNRHPLRVSRILTEEMKITDEHSVLIALCHDLGEWSDYDLNDLKSEFDENTYQGVKALTWDQKGKWSDFVEKIVSSDLDNLVAIKIADKLDNNRAVALSGSSKEKLKAKKKTLEVILPLVQQYHPAMVTAYDEVLSRLY